MEIRNDLAAERILLGAVLAGQRVEPLSRIVNPSDFHQPRHEAIWAAILRVVEAGNSVDVASVRLALDHAGAKVDPLYLMELYGEASLTADGSFHAERVVEEARARRLVAAGHAITLAGESRNLTSSEAQDIARTRLDEALADRQRADVIRIGDVLPEVIAIAESGHSPALSTPWPDVDRLIGGMAPGRLVIVGARPGIGKSVMGTNLAHHMAARHEHAVVIVSAEMPRLEVTQRMLAAATSVNLDGLLNGTVDERQWDSIRKHYDAINALPVFVNDESSPSLTSIRSHIQDVRRQREDVALIVVDYLQLLSAPESGRNSSRTEKLGEISRGLKILAREMNACVVAMAQVNREGTKAGAKPTMSDLRESGSIEADADQVILLHRGDADIPDIEVLVDKNRWGPRGVATLQMAGHYARLGSVSWSPTRGIA